MILNEALRLYCRKYNIGGRTLGKLTGTNESTAARFLRGEVTINSTDYASIVAWMTTTVHESKASQDAVKQPPAAPHK